MISDLITYLESKSTITAFVGTNPNERIYVARRPQADSLPAIVIDYTSSDHVPSLDGASGLVSTNISISSFSTSSLQAEQMGDALRLIFDGYNSSASVSIGSLDVRSVDLQSDSLSYLAPVDGSDVGVYEFEQQYEITFTETIPSF